MHPAARCLLLLAGLVVLAGGGAARGQDGEEPAGETPPAGASAPASGEQPLVAEAARALAAARPTLDTAFQRLAVHDWDACIGPFREVAEALAPHPLLGGLRDQCLYNAACAYARTDRPGEAVAALAESLAHGLRPVATPVADGRVVLGPGLTFAHVLVDPDLDSLRERADYRAVLDGLLRAGTPRLVPTAAADGAGPVPGVVVVLPEDHDVERGAEPWLAALAEAPAVLAFVEGPVRPSPRARRWLLLDGDDRFGVEKVAAALDALRADPRVDRRRTFLVALTSGAGEVALAAALSRPRDVAGLALAPFRYHAVWHADALHGLRAACGDAPWTVSCVTPDDAFPQDLAGAGVVVDRRAPPPPIVAPEARGAALRQTVLDGLRDLLR